MRKFTWFIVLLVMVGASTSDLPFQVAAQTPPPPTIGTAAFVIASSVMPCYTGCGGIANPPTSNADYEQQVIELVNAERWNNGQLPPLKREDTLTHAARYHANDMTHDNYFKHDTYDRVNGNLVFVCSTWDRVIGYYGSGWSGLAENIAWGYSTPQSVMQGLMNSSGHRANILNPNYREIGVGYVSSRWVQNFGAKSARYPIVINREAATTDHYRVNLYIYGAGTWTEMRLRNNSGDWTAWQPFQTNVVWYLPKTRGTHTVSVEQRKTGSSTASSDTIYLTQDFMATLGGIPASATFLYSIPEGVFVPPQQSVTPHNTTTADALAWTLTTQGNWFTVTPASGNTPGALFIITPNTPSSPTPGVWTGAVTVTVTNPPDTLNNAQRITLTLRVIDTPIRRVYLPLTLWQ